MADSRTSTSIERRVSLLLFFKALLQPIMDIFRNQVRKVTAECSNLADEGGTGKAVLLAGHNKDGLYAGHSPVSHSKLELILNICKASQTSQDNIRLFISSIFNGEPVETLNRDAWHIGHQLSYHLHPLFRGKELVFDRTSPDCDDKLVKELHSPVDNIQMPVCNGVKGAWENRSHKFPSHQYTFLSAGNW